MADPKSGRIKVIVQNPTKEVLAAIHEKSKGLDMDVVEVRTKDGSAHAIIVKGPCIDSHTEDLGLAVSEGVMRKVVNDMIEAAVACKKR